MAPAPARREPYGFARLESDPKHPEFLILRTPPDVSDLILETFKPAQRIPGTPPGTWAVHRDRLPSLQTWSRYNSVPIRDDSAQVRGERTRPVECGNIVGWLDRNGRDAAEGDPGAVPVKCCAPYLADRIPKFCAVCGQRAKPVTFDEDKPLIGNRCTACETLVRGGAAYCPRCGAPMPEKATIRPPAVITERETLPEPVTVGSALDQLVDAQGWTRAPLWTHDDAVGAVEGDRPIEDVDLPPGNVNPETGEVIAEERACTECFRPTTSETGLCDRCAAKADEADDQPEPTGEEPPPW